MRRGVVQALVAVAIVVAGGLAGYAGPVRAADPAFTRTWERTDRPVAEGAVTRTWMWGPGPNAETREDYAQSPGGSRSVVYYDKSRMEITNPNGDPDSVWFVTNGLLVVELVSGRMQVGDSQFVDGTPADVNVAGDPDAPDPITYALLGQLLGAPAAADGAPLVLVATASGGTLTVREDASYARYGATAAFRVSVPGIDHQVASPFWAFMNASGTVWQDGGYQQAPLFENPFYATGYPITEAYWTRAVVGGSAKDVLLQCFERRCLTWTPDNAPEWQVEMGNVGQHYLRWRYGDTPPPPPACDPAYPTICVPSPPPDLDCLDIPYRSFTVLPPDPHGFDTNGNGIGCETGAGAWGATRLWALSFGL